jgi:aminoglycoside phosphotransferase (APT) family kinase protein
MPATDDVALDCERLNAWLGDRLPGDGALLSASRLGEGTGIANALFLITRGNHEWILRRPPAVKNDPSASNTEREWRILNALNGTTVPHPAAVLYCADVDVLGAPFLVMEVVDGFTPGFELPEPFSSDMNLRHELAMAYVDGIAELSAVDWRARGLEGLGKPEGFLERQVSRWLAQLDRYQTRDLPHLEFLADWLGSNRPTMSAAGIIHGDYSPFNVMVAPQSPARLAAIIDWDTGTIGDPLIDLGHLLARWTEPGEEPVITLQAGGVDGYPTRAGLAERYGVRTGRDLSALPYYEALALFKLAVILEGRHAMEVKMGVAAEHTSMATIVPALLSGAADFATCKRT